MTSLVLTIRARIYRDGLVAALSSRPSFTVASAGADVASAIVSLERFQPDALLLDVGVGCAPEIVVLAQQASPSTKLVALGIRTDCCEELLSWAEAGAVGFVTCDNSIDELVTCINLALYGELACSPRTSATLLRRLVQLAAERSPLINGQPQLTPRQSQILPLLRAGKSNKQIARDLGIELATVKNHVHHLLQRLKVRHRDEAADVTSPHAHRTRPTSV